MINRNRIFITLAIGLIALSLVLTACGGGQSAAQPPAATQPPATQPPVATQPPATQEPPTVQPTSAQPAPEFKAGQQWNGTFLEPWGARTNMNLLVDKVDGATFKGKMNWIFSDATHKCTALLLLNGETFQNVTTATEQERWSQHPDFANGATTGLWIRWTQTQQTVGNSNCGVNVGDWWYAHIGNDGTLLGIRFMNSTDAKPANGDLNLTLGK